MRKLPATKRILQTAEQHLSSVDDTMKAIITTYGRCTLQPQTDYFRVLCSSIISQQLSTKAAATIERRFVELLGNNVSPEKVIALSIEDLRGVGCSNAKANYLLNLATHAQTGTLPFDRLDAMSDEEVIAGLVHVKGIGRWTAEMFLMFAMNRLDIFSPDDLGLRNAIIRHYGEVHGFNGTTKNKEFGIFAERWKPYRTVASWYLWRSLENKPVPVNDTSPDSTLSAYTLAVGR